MSAGARLGAAVCTLLLVAASPAAWSQTDAPATMRAILDSLAVLLPHSVEPERFADPLHEDEILEALESMVRNAAALEQHVLGLDPSYDHVRATLHGDAREALDAFRAEEYHAARFVVRNLTENCFACHTRRPFADADQLASRLATIDVTTVPIEERLRLLVALRRFDDAQSYAEGLLAEPSLSPTRIDTMGTFEEYLKVSIRVRRDLARPRDALQEFLEREDLPVYLDMQVMDWILALDELAANDTSAEPLTRARALLDEARRRSLYIRDRRGLIHATAASGLLHQYVQSAPEATADLAEAYYLLGLAEAQISRTIWVPETEFFLESSIRVDPKAPSARPAYAFLEQYVIASYTGSAGLELPEGAWQRLLELRALIEE